MGKRSSLPHFSFSFSKSGEWGEVSQSAGATFLPSSLSFPAARRKGRKKRKEGGQSLGRAVQEMESGKGQFSRPRTERKGRRRRRKKKKLPFPEGKNLTVEVSCSTVFARIRSLDWSHSPPPAHDVGRRKEEEEGGRCFIVVVVIIIIGVDAAAG